MAFAQKVLVQGFLCATSVSSVPLVVWFYSEFINYRDFADENADENRRSLWRSAA